MHGVQESTHVRKGIVETGVSTNPRIDAAVVHIEVNEMMKDKRSSHDTSRGHNALHNARTLPATTGCNRHLNLFLEVRHSQSGF